MSRFTTILATVALIGASTLAAGAQTSQLERLVAHDMSFYQRNVDVSTLSNAQLSAIYQIMHNSRRSTNQKRLLIRSVLGGRNTLRGLFGYRYRPGYAQATRLRRHSVGRSYY